MNKLKLLANLLLAPLYFVLLICYGLPGLIAMAWAETVDGVKASIQIHWN